jgi:hypothetical protein
LAGRGLAVILLALLEGLEDFEYRIDTKMVSMSFPA